MKVTNLDTIVKGLLIGRGYPIHFYLQFLYYGSRIFEEIHFDSLQSVKTVKIDINDYGAIPLPCDFMDWVKVGISNGQFIRPLSSREGLTNLNNFDSTTGKKIPYGQQIDGFDIATFDTAFFAGAQTYYNDNGEFIGRMFGVGSGDNAYTFKFLPERNEIQLHEQVPATSIVLQYMTDGSCIDNATMITPYAKGTIETGIIWQYKENSRAYGSGERREARLQHEHQHLILRARKNELTKDKIFAIVRRHTHGAIKG